MAAKYYMLIASLPHLPHFRQAQRLPINPQRLRWRRSALRPEDAADLDLALDMLHWARHSAEESDAQIDAQYRRTVARIRNESLRSYVEEIMAQRSVLAALRRKALGMPAPSEEDRCGVGRWHNLTRNRWDRDELGLTPRFPWIPQARAMLAEGRSAELEMLLMEVTWRKASKIAEADPFGFQAVFAYVFKWDLLSRHLVQDAIKAGERFSQLVDEVIHEQQSASTR